jgi:uncharacterized protein YfdQ (DUF2303 family)
MFDKSAIEKIQELEVTSNLNSSIDRLGIPHKVLFAPEHFSLNSLEKFNDSRFRFRGNLSTKSIKAFADYALVHKSDGSAVFIDADTMKAKLFIDLGNQALPGHCEHTALVSLEKSAAYTELLNIVGQRKTQKEIAEFIEDWRNFLTASAEANEDGVADNISIVKALHAVRKITIEAKSTSDTETRNFGARSASMESIDVKSADMPPAFFHFTCEPCQGLSERTFDLRLSVITDRVPALVLRIVRFEEHKDQMAEEFKSIIENEIDSEIKTYVGSFTA